MIRAAIAAGIRPTAMLFQEDPAKPWRRHDFLLLEALQIMEAERCGQCGLPRWMCHDETGGVQFRIEGDECVVKREIDVQNEKDAKADKKNHGISLQPAPYFVDGADWISVRDSYYKGLIERNEERASDLAEIEGNNNPEE